MDQRARRPRFAALRPALRRRFHRRRRLALATPSTAGHAASLLIIVSVGVIGSIVSSTHPVTPNAALARGIEWITVNHITANSWIQLVILLLALFNIRSIWLALLAMRLNTPIEVRLLDNATNDQMLDTHPLDVVFRDYLALSRLYEIPAVPGDREPDRIIDVLNVPAARGWRGVLAAAYSYALPRRAYVISASLITRHEDQGCGVSIQVRRLPGAAVHIATQWSTTFERALQRAAYAVAAHVVQQTTACRSAPWSEWQGRTRPIPASLFRDYQRAKRMMIERRYDEALALYHRALLQDPDNIAMRYDVGQLFERLRLYPDALLMYMQLTNEIFPVIVSSESSLPPGRVSQPRWWPDEDNLDPFIIRYRYAVLLGLGGLLARDLLGTRSSDMRGWVSGAGPDGAESARKHELRPWRATEIAELRRTLSTSLDPIYAGYCKACDKTIRRSLGKMLTASALTQTALEKTAVSVERFLLACAEREFDTLLDDIENLERGGLGLRRRRQSALTSVAVREARLTVTYRRKHLQSGPGTWPVDIRQMSSDLATTGYVADSSSNWLEHYNAACHYALAIVTDRVEKVGHEKYAIAAVAALERATKSGDAVDFVTSKRSWLQGGDPDLAGLRCYTCFRAFEARIFTFPLPATREILRYELYSYLRAIIQQASGHLEILWRTRAAASGRNLSMAEFEEWWRLELRAWEMAIRMGRFYFQWQTRQAVLEALRNWLESFGPEFHPIAYPDLLQDGYVTDSGNYSLTEDLLTQTENILSYLGSKCGNLMAHQADNGSHVFGNTRLWADYAASRSRSDGRHPTTGADLTTVCLSRSAVWAALRQWAQHPGSAGERAFDITIASLPAPTRPGSRDGPVAAARLPRQLSHGQD
jgi:tetratricopeptide (TPR) repeat protein